VYFFIANLYLCAGSIRNRSHEANRLLRSNGSVGRPIPFVATALQEQTTASHLFITGSRGLEQRLVILTASVSMWSSGLLLPCGLVSRRQHLWETHCPVFWAEDSGFFHEIYLEISYDSQNEQSLIISLNSMNKLLRNTDFILKKIF
jgi:hypothetical protein